MRVLGIVPAPYDTNPGQRYRIEQWERSLRSQRLAVDFLPFASPETLRCLYESGQFIKKSVLLAKDFIRRFSATDLARRYDLIYLYREAAIAGPPWIEERLARTGVPIIFDFDDAIFLRSPSGANRRFNFLKFASSRTRRICELSAHVIVGNEYLATYARRYAKNVSVVPTTIDLRQYLLGVHVTNDPPVIGWTGSHSTIGHLDSIRGVLQKLAKRRKFRLRVLGVPGYRIEGVNVEAIAWRSSTEADDLRILDVGLMPLPDDEWCKGKCGCKALQYMALGIPCICSPVGANRDIIRHHLNGLFAVTEEDWLRQIQLLMDSPDLRAALGSAGRETVENTYSADIGATAIRQIFEATLASNNSSKDSLGRVQAIASEGSLMVHRGYSG